MTKNELLKRHEISENDYELINKLYDYLSFSEDTEEELCERIDNDLTNDYLTCSLAKNGNYYWNYFDGASCAVILEKGNIINEEEEIDELMGWGE